MFVSSGYQISYPWFQEGNQLDVRAITKFNIYNSGSLLTALFTKIWTHYNFYAFECQLLEIAIISVIKKVSFVSSDFRSWPMKTCLTNAFALVCLATVHEFHKTLVSLLNVKKSSIVSLEYSTQHN